MAVNQRNTTIASFNYLIEVGSIPFESRISYLKKLQTRRNASRQKNVKLLKCIYQYIDENKISEWCALDVCKQTGLNINALYIQKSRLLKGIREYLFSWKETEKQIETRVSEEFKKRSFYKMGEDLIVLTHEKALKMADIGMMREAKNMYVKLEKSVKKSYISQSTKYLLLSETYEFLAYYHFTKRQKSKLQYFSAELEKISETIKVLNLNISHEAYTILNIRLNLSKSYINGINWYSDSETGMKSDFNDKVYRLSKESNNYSYLLKVLHGMAIFELTKDSGSKENFVNARKICNEGFETAQKHKYRSAQLTFASMLYYIKAQQNPTSNKLNNENIIDYYRKIKSTNSFSVWTIYLENSIAMTYYPKKKREVLEIFREQIASNVMYGDLAFAVYWKFILDSEMYTDELIKFFDGHNIEYIGYLSIRKVNNTLLDDIKKICLNTECYHKKINDFGLNWLVQKLKLTAYYFREDGYDYNEVTEQLKVMEHLKKKSKIKHGLKNYELLKLGFEMLELEHDPKKLLNRYELKFKKTIEDFKNNPKKFTITDYAIISSLARRLRCKEITAIVKNLYHWLEANHREILAPALREIEERTSKVKLIDGSKQSAA